MTESEAVTNYIDFIMMEKMCHPIAVTLFDSRQEPMTHFGKHDRGLLESALNNPRQTFGGKDLYPTLSKKAAILYYSLIKNHPFENGNKRTATAALLVFLHINNRWVSGTGQGTEDYLVELAKRVAASEGDSQRKNFLEEIENWIDKNIVVRN
jgi:death-on-curing family protein